MAEWFFPLLALAVGLVAALSAAIGLPPLVAFVAGALIVLVARRFASGAEEPLAEPLPDPVPPVLPTPDLGRALVEKLPAPLIVIARNGSVAYANPAAHAILPHLEAGAHFSHLIRAPDFVAAVTATLADGAERACRFTAYHGSERHFEARVGLLPADPAFGTDRRAIVQLEDRTEPRKAEQLRSDFIANASHELRTPLASVIGYIETLQHHARDDAEARERFLGVMAREAGRMQRLVDDLMSLSRIEMSEHLRPVEVWSLNRIVTECAAALLPMARQQGTDLRLDLDAATGEVTGDRDQLAQVFTNLIDNAIKYGGPGGTVRVVTALPSKAHPNRYGITVADTGPGIAREHIHRLTERFYRVNVSHSRNKGGTGLGLAIVKHILNRHKGRLEIASTPGEGSRFTVWLPKAASGHAGRQTRSPGSDEAKHVGI
jgi:two-component system phosphate regulon sensor histidine kinase PhoR